ERGFEAGHVLPRAKFKNATDNDLSLASSSKRLRLLRRLFHRNKVGPVVGDRQFVAGIALGKRSNLTVNFIPQDRMVGASPVQEKSIIMGEDWTWKSFVAAFQ